MTVEIKFTPQRLKYLVVELEKRIRVSTGKPIRLDIELYFDNLKKYKKDPLKENFPTLTTLEKLSAMIQKVKEEDLIDIFFDCLNISTTPRITAAILNYYFNEYSNSLVKNYLFHHIHLEILNTKGWKIFSRYREVFFKGDIKKNIVSFIIQQRIPFQDIPDRIGMVEPYRLREDSLSLLCEDKNLFNSYLKVLSLEHIMAILKNDQLQRLHNSIWNYSLPLYVKEAKQQKIKSDTDHPLFSIAKLRLKPTKSPQWIRLSEQARLAYQDWALGARLEAFFKQDTNNARILFWKGHLRNIEEIKEIDYRGTIGAFSIAIGKYEFVEFREVGAIYVYHKGSIRIPKSVTNLDRDLKFREKVVNAGIGVEYGEGWIAHLGKVWTGRVTKLINEALKK
jgi:hypothetical protein